MQVSRTSATAAGLLDVREAPRHEVAGGEGGRCQQARYGELRLVAELVATHVRPWRALERAKHRRAVVERGEKAAERSGLLGSAVGHSIPPAEGDRRRRRDSGSNLGKRCARVVLAHEVSMLIGAGMTQCRSAWPRVNTSMTRMRPPRHRQARG